MDATKYYGMRITSAVLDENCLRLGFDGGRSIQIEDDGQQCCEQRYMTCDDDAQSLVGNLLMRIETKGAPDIETDDGAHEDAHEQVFIEVGTDVGFITIASHNVHNGYYGGFDLTIKES